VIARRDFNQERTIPIDERSVRWPDGASVSLPFPYGRVGGTYYWNPGSPTAPHWTFTRSFGLAGAGAHVTYLRKGMTSSDTLGQGFSGSVSTVFPSVNLNGTDPDGGDYTPDPGRLE
jgi:hypothetical protein